MKKGRLSKAECRFIRDNHKNMSIARLAKEMDRHEETIAEYVKKKHSVGATDAESAAYSLEDRPYYSELKNQFTTEELELFKYHWGRIVSQFKSDVFPTEEMQIIDAVKLEILMNRALKTNKDNIEAINRLEGEVEQLLETPLDSRHPDDMENIMNLERQIGVLRGSQDSINKDYRDLQDKKGRMLKEMKGTREQRIKRLEDSKDSFPSWLATLIQDPERMREYGLQMEKMRMAMDIERGRLSQLHKYEDGAIDRPFLNDKSVEGQND